MDFLSGTQRINVIYCKRFPTRGGQGDAEERPERLCASTNGYNCKLTQLFTVEKVEYNTYNWTEAIYVTGNTLDEDGNNVLSVDSKITGFGSGVYSVTIYKRDSGSNTEPHIVKINNGSDYDFAAHIDDYLLSTETGYNEYTFVLECDENHIASDIIFIIMAPEPEPEPEPEPTE